MSQSQRRQQQQNTNVFGGGNRDDEYTTLPFPSASSSSNEPTAFQSFVNTELKFNHNSQHTTNLCDSANVGCCILSFTKCQSKAQGNIIVGGYCEYHNRMLFKRRYFNMPLNDGVSVVPVSYVPVQYKPFFFLTSMMKIGMSVHEFEALLQDVNGVSSEEKYKIAKFFSILSYPANAISTERESSIFKSYMQEIMYYYSDLINMYYNIIKYLLVPVIISDAYAQMIKSNEWYDSILKDETVERREFDGKTLFFIPLERFNVLDILAILSYHLDVRINQTGYAANCKIADGRFIHGCGQGINNAIENYNLITNESQYKEYGREIRELLMADKHMKTVSNLDVMVLSVVQADNAYIPSSIRLSITKAIVPNHDFDIQQIQLVKNAAVQNYN